MAREHPDAVSYRAATSLLPRPSPTKPASTVEPMIRTGGTGVPEQW
jgi:hypothetical protein